MNLTYDQIRAIVAPGGRPALVEGFATYLNKYGDKYGVNTYLRVCHFAAQCAEESDHFNTLHEYASGAEYQGRLGNTQPGDGIRFKGAGYIELTGRYNYEAAGKRLGLDLIGHPELALQPEVGMLVSLDYWQQHGCNTYADKDDILTITHLVNGGENGLATRQLFLRNAKVALKGADFTGAPTNVQVPSAPAPAPATTAMDDVKAYQQQLSALGLYNGPINGVAVSSKAAVLLFQGRHPELKADGIVGPATRAALLHDVAALAGPVVSPVKPAAATAITAGAAVVVAGGAAISTGIPWLWLVGAAVAAIAVVLFFVIRAKRG